MKKLGLISDKKSKKVFLLPEQVTTLTSKNVEVYVNAGYGNGLNITDDKYLQAGAKICKKSEEVITKADVVLKVNAFKKSEIASGSKKIFVTMANYVINPDMLFEMLKNNTTGLAWSCLENKDGYVFFPELEAIKGRHCINQMVWAWANKGLGLTNTKAGITRPRVLILNATWAAYEATRACLANNIDVTILDNDLTYLKDFASSLEIKKLESIFGAKVSIDNANFETLMKHFKTHNGFINTCIDPISKTKVRITNEMAKCMPAGSFMVDAACENGYGFNFQKDFVSDKVEYKQLDNVIYSCVENITDLYPMASSQLISQKSVDYLLTLLDKGVDGSNAIANTIVAEEGKVVNASVKTQLRLY